MKYIQGRNSLILNLAEKSEIKNSGHATQTYARQFNPATNVKNRLLSGYADRNSLLGLHINHIIIPAPDPTTRKYHEPQLYNNNFKPNSNLIPVGKNV